MAEKIVNWDVKHQCLQNFKTRQLVPVTRLFCPIQRSNDIPSFKHSVVQDQMSTLTRQHFNCLFACLAVEVLKVHFSIFPQREIIGRCKVEKQENT